MIVNFLHANSQAITEFIVNGLVINPEHINCNTFEERYKLYEEKFYDLTRNLSDKEQNEISTISDKLNNLYFEMGMKAGIMFAISMELTK